MNRFIVPKVPVASTLPNGDGPRFGVLKIEIAGRAMRSEFHPKLPTQLPSKPDGCGLQATLQNAAIRNASESAVEKSRWVVVTIDARAVELKDLPSELRPKDPCDFVPGVESCESEADAVRIATDRNLRILTEEKPPTAWWIPIVSKPSLRTLPTESPVPQKVREDKFSRIMKRREERDARKRERQPATPPKINGPACVRIADLRFVPTECVTYTIAKGVTEEMLVNAIDD